MGLLSLKLTNDISKIPRRTARDTNCDCPQLSRQLVKQQRSNSPTKTPNRKQLEGNSAIEASEPTISLFFATFDVLFINFPILQLCQASALTPRHNLGKERFTSEISNKKQVPKRAQRPPVSLADCLPLGNDDFLIHIS